MSKDKPISVPVDWSPWPHQRAFWNARFRDDKKRFVEVWHRRAGKDLTAENMCVVEMFKRPGTYWHIFPTYAQAKKAIWQGSTNDGRKFLNYIPSERIIRTRNDEMLVEVNVGDEKDVDSKGNPTKTSIYQFIGGDQPDRLVGTNVMGVILSEYSLMNPVAWQLIEPILEMNDGWAAFIFTPRGYNHAHGLWKSVKDDPEWHTSVLDIMKTSKPDGSQIMTPERVQKLIDREMKAGNEEFEAIARQEYYCDWSAPMSGAYYGKQMDAADLEGRIGEVRWEKERPVYTWWDLGVRDSMVIWFVQIINGWIHVIDYMAHSGEGIEWYAKELDKKPYVYAKHYAPHDVKQREVGTGKSVLEVAAALGLRFTVVPKLSVENGINASRLALPKSKFDAVKCEHGIAALRQYRKKWDESNKVWSAKPVHDWTSHPADAYRTGAIMVPELTPRVDKPVDWNKTPTWDDVLSEHDDTMRRRRRNRGTYARL